MNSPALQVAIDRLPPGHIDDERDAEAEDHLRHSNAH